MNTDNHSHSSHLVIAISRQYGSGGRFIGRLLAQRLDIPLYDKELITITAEKDGISESILANLEEQAASRLLYSQANTFNRFSPGIPYGNLPLNDRIFLAQSAVVRELAHKGPCIIIGRCASYVLQDNPNLINVFIHADLEDRMKRAVRFYNLNAATAEKTILKTDKKRKEYHEYYAGSRWGQADCYDLCIKSDCLGVEASAEVIERFVRLKLNKNLGS